MRAAGRIVFPYKYLLSNIIFNSLLKLEQSLALLFINFLLQPITTF